MEDDAHELKELVVKEDESTSPKPHEMKEVVEAFPKMTLWSEVHKELKNDKMTPISNVDECIFHPNKELIVTIVKEKEKNFKKMIVEDYVLKLQIEHTYRFLGTNGEGNHHSLIP